MKLLLLLTFITAAIYEGHPCNNNKGDKDQDLQLTTLKPPVRIPVCDRKPTRGVKCKKRNGKYGFYFNSFTKSCRRFKDKCGDNIFKTPEQCKKMCQPQTKKTLPPKCKRLPPFPMCKKFSPRRTGYYYNETSGQCKPYKYICYNSPFETRKQCEETCNVQKPEPTSGDVVWEAPKKTTLPPMCDRHPPFATCYLGAPTKTGYYYDKTSGQCKTYGYVCHNKNKAFNTLQQCEETCNVQNSEHQEVTASNFSRPLICGIALACRSLPELKNWEYGFQYNQSTGSCFRFKDKCGMGFKNQKACEKNCLPKSFLAPMCNRHPPFADCRRGGPGQKGYYYDTGSGECKSYEYLCGNHNKAFNTLKQCEESCVYQKAFLRKSNGASNLLNNITTTCSQPPKTGRCRAYFTRYYFDTKLWKCRFFVYGGCGGNDNNFGSTGKCEQTCLPSMA